MYYLLIFYFNHGIDLVVMKMMKINQRHCLNARVTLVKSCQLANMVSKTLVASEDKYPIQKSTHENNDVHYIEILLSRR